MPRTLYQNPKRKAMPKAEVPTRRAGRWTYDAELKQLRDENGQFTTGDDLLVDNLEPVTLMHNGHLAGYATTVWIRGMLERGVVQVCKTCTRMVGIADVEIVSDETRDP